MLKSAKIAPCFIAKYNCGKNKIMNLFTLKKKNKHTHALPLANGVGFEYILSKVNFISPKTKKNAKENLLKSFNIHDTTLSVLKQNRFRFIHPPLLQKYFP